MCSSFFSKIRAIIKTLLFFPSSGTKASTYQYAVISWYTTHVYCTYIQICKYEEGRFMIKAFMKVSYFHTAEMVLCFIK